MKKLCLIFIILLLNLNVNAQEEENLFSNSNEVRMGFFHFFASTFFIGYEHIFDKSGLVINAALTLHEDYYEQRLGGFGELQYRLYAPLAGTNIFFVSMDGVYFGPYLNYRYLDITEITQEYNDISGLWEEVSRYSYFSSVGAGALAGMKFSLLKRITMDINLGGGIKYCLNKKNDETGYYSDIFSPGYTGILPKGNITFGIRF